MENQNKEIPAVPKTEFEYFGTTFKLKKNVFQVIGEMQDLNDELQDKIDEATIDLDLNEYLPFKIKIEENRIARQQIVDNITMDVEAKDKRLAELDEGLLKHQSELKNNWKAWKQYERLNRKVSKVTTQFVTAENYLQRYFTILLEGDLSKIDYSSEDVTKMLKEVQTGFFFLNSQKQS